MGKFKRFRPSPGTMVLAVILLFVSLGGLGYAAATIGTSDIKDGAVTKRKLHDDAVNTEKVKNRSLTGQDINEKTLDQVPSANHARTADSAEASNVMSAVVGQGATGCTLLRTPDDGVSTAIAGTSADPPAASACAVDFSRDVTDCTYVAGIGQNNSEEAPAGLTTTAPRSGNPEAVFVRTMNVNGNNAIRPFHLQVVC